MSYKVGDRIKFKVEKRPYKIISCDSRYLICIKPFNVLHTYLYTIVDLQEGIRGPEDSIFGRYDLWEPKDVAQCLADLQSGDAKVSLRRMIALDLETT